MDYNPKYKVKFYTEINGKQPFLTWLNSIKDADILRLIWLRIYRIKTGNLGDYKSLGGNLFELRLFVGKGYRIYFTIESNTIILLLSGGDKSDQEKDIKKAKQYLDDYKRGSQ